MPFDVLDNLAALTEDSWLYQQMAEMDVSKLPVGASVPALGLSNKAVYEGDVGAGRNPPSKDDFGDSETVFKHVSLKCKLSIFFNFLVH